MQKLEKWQPLIITSLLILAGLMAQQIHNAHQSKLLSQECDQVLEIIDEAEEPSGKRV